MSRRTDLKRKLLLEERERQWQTLQIPITVIPDFGQEQGSCDCDSGEDYASCCGADGLITKPTPIRGAFVLELIEKAFHQDVKIRDPHVRAKAYFDNLPEGHITVTTDANINRAHKAILDEPVGKLPPVLYHCTYTHLANRILVEGLKPRGITGNDNYREQKLSSHPDHVYMTEAHLSFYVSRLNDAPATILAIDTAQLDESRLYPDEDYAALILAMQERRPKPKVEGTRQRITAVSEILEARDRIEEFKHLWHASLLGYGNIAYRGAIPPNAIKRATKSFFTGSENKHRFIVESDYLLAGYPFDPTYVKGMRDNLLAEAAA